MSSAASTEISRRSTRSSGWRAAEERASHRLQRRLPLVRCRARLVCRDRARRRAPSRDPRQCRDRNRAQRRHRRRLRLRLSGFGRRGYGRAARTKSWATCARSPPRCRRAARGSPRCRCISSPTVGGLRVGIVHGDATSLAGWSFAHDALDEPGAPARLDGDAGERRASTCSPRPTPVSPPCATSRCRRAASP